MIQRIRPFDPFPFPFHLTIPNLAGIIALLAEASV